MEAFLFSVNNVLPVLLFIVLGYFLKKRKSFSERTIQDMDKLCFRMLLPFSLFKSIYNINMDVAFNTKLVLFGMGGVMLVILVLCLTVPLFMHERKRVGAFIQGVYRGNFLLLGTPLAANMFGAEGEQNVAMLLPFAIATFNVFAVIILSIYGAKNGKGKIHVGQLLLGIFKNPLIIATLLALFARFLPFRLPIFMTKFVSDVGTMATPLALIMLGAQFEFKGFKSNFRAAAIATFLRLIVVPVVLLGTAILLGWRGAELGVLFILFSVPTAVSSHIMAINLGCDGDLAGAILVCSTLVSMFTLFFGSFLLELMHFI